MEFIVCNIFLRNESNISESMFDLEVLKEVAFSAKTQVKIPNGRKDITYGLVLIPVAPPRGQLSQEEVIYRDKVKSRTTFSGMDEGQVLDSLQALFEGAKQLDIDKVKFSVDIVAKISDNYSITYTDGSFKKETTQASYGVVRILDENAQSGVLEEFTGKLYDYQKLSGVIESGTNNIGELTAIKVAVENFDDRKYQIIISDSEYGIKSFREWYYTWRENGFRNYSKKPISNKDLITGTFDAMSSSGKLIFFKWVKGHSKKTFNEMCDELAKEALKIEKN